VRFTPFVNKKSLSFRHPSDDSSRESQNRTGFSIRGILDRKEEKLEALADPMDE
jgi:hypothetical protein